MRRVVGFCLLTIALCANGAAGAIMQKKNFSASGALGVGSPTGDLKDAATWDLSGTAGLEYRAWGPLAVGVLGGYRYWFTTDELQAELETEIDAELGSGYTGTPRLRWYDLLVSLRYSFLRGRSASPYLAIMGGNAWVKRGAKVFNGASVQEFRGQRLSWAAEVSETNSGFAWGLGGGIELSAIERTSGIFEVLFLSHKAGGETLSFIEARVGLRVVLAKSP